MPIRFKCPNPKCQKVLSVKDQLAGKKAACPVCKQPLTIPSLAPPKAPDRAQRPTTDDASAATTTDAPADAEDLAMSLLADEVKPSGPVQQPKTISTTCLYCEEEVQFDVALAGKQAPCPNPECRRIIKVPQLTKQEKIDWRNTAPGLPSGARRSTEPAPQGAWGSTAKAIVSGEALEHAGALPSQRRAPLSKSQWAVRILLGGAAVGLVAVGVMVVLNWMGGKKQQKLFDKAMAAVSKGDKSPIKGAEAAVINLSAGQYHLRRNERDCVKPDKGDAGAWNQFGQARASLHAVKSNPECDSLLIELALAQIDLGGSPEQVSDGKRLAWGNVQKELGNTFKAIRDAEARAEGLRRVTRKLIEKGQAGLAEELAQQLSDVPLAVVGLEFQRAGEDARAEKLLKQIVGKLEEARPKRGKPPPPLKGTPEPETVTFLGAGTNDKTKELPAAKSPEEKDVVQVGKAVALAWQKKHGAARTEANKARTAVLKLEALAAIADAPGDEGEVKATVEAAMQLAETGFGGKSVPPWAILRLVPIGLRAGVEEDRLLALAAKISTKDGLKCWAQLPVVRARLAREGGKAEESLADQVEKGTLANRLVRVELAYHNARKDSSADKAVESWDESLRPFGYMGVALGLQGGN